MDRLRGYNVKSIEEISKELQTYSLYDSDMLDEINKESQQEYDKRETYIHDIIDTLKQIQNNTANLTTIVTLINKSNENQDELIEVITELLSIAKETNKKEAESKYRQILNKISKFNGDIKTIQTLTTLANAIITAINTLG